MARITIDPFTRIEGHLRIDVEIEDGKVKDAWTTGTLFRGFEIILKGRDPRDACHITQRICGVCPTSHGHASSMSMDDAFKIKVPANGRIIRNIIEGAQFVHSHILWFYHLNALDYVDVVSALSAQPAEASLKKVQAKLKSFVDSGQLGPFANAYWGHPAYKLPPEVNLIAVAHYLEALEMQAKAAQVSALFGGRMPMTMTSPPGGVTHVPTVDDLKNYLFRVKELQDWIDNVFIADLMAIAPFYLDAAGVGKGPANFLSWGVFEDASFDPKKRLLPRGAIFAADFPTVHEARAVDVLEYTGHSWYKDSKPLNPAVGVTDPEYTEYDPDKKYTWAKAPRLQGKPMEVGALARMVVAYASGQPTAKKLIDDTLAKIGHPGQPQVLFGIIGRIAARALECKMVADSMYQWGMDLIENIKKGNTAVYADYQIPDKAQGIGLWEAPRGALGHWIDVEDKKIKNYQCVVPTTWNVCPRDDNGVRGPIEEALIGTEVADAEKPLEVMRVVHSFDPCLACTVHVIHPESNRIMDFKVS
ncbi:MAG TPA: nickel-dependent hydrogenase large subunit [Desulfobulbaceae bacterium]|nr:MAG: hydrogenase 2 large subunit [Deltaproteobacteria bacterium RIFOXYD12_FULL_53_23]HCC55278.1 nickel-dependent hydrogenase large subunit [Desulfobulbaceae bacterium]